MDKRGMESPKVLARSDRPKRSIRAAAAAELFSPLSPQQAALRNPANQLGCSVAFGQLTYIGNQGRDMLVIISKRWAEATGPGQAPESFL